MREDRTSRDQGSGIDQRPGPGTGTAGPGTQPGPRLPDGPGHGDPADQLRPGRQQPGRRDRSRAAPGGRASRREGYWSRRSRRRQQRLRLRASRRTLVGRHPLAAALCAVLLVLTPVWVSLGGALTNPALGTSSGARGAEWLRTHGASPVVNWAENFWYSHHPPPVGGKPASSALPGALSSGRASAAAGSAVAHLKPPARMTSPAGQRLPGEGVWHPAGRRVGGRPALYETWVRPDAVHTSLVIGVAWMDSKLLRASLYSGSTIPGGSRFTHTAPIPRAAARSLVAAFNAGFLMNNAQGGYYTDHKTIVPLRNGAASAVIYRNGSMNIVSWGQGGARLGPDVVSVRQNLDLLVSNGNAVPGLNPKDTTRWGFTLGNAVDVWRSGIGVTASGALVYAGGPGLNITTLADILAKTGAIRAMELDINTDWVNFASYAPGTAAGAATAANGTDLLPGMFGAPARYFQSWWSRDFFTVSARPVATARTGR